MDFNPGIDGTLKSITAESALAELLVLLKMAENAAVKANSSFTPRIQLSFDTYSSLVSFAGSIKFEFVIDPATRALIFDCEEYLP